MDPSTPVLEICANSYQSARNAQDGGAHRVELCQNLEQGGITPSYGLIKRCSGTLNIPVYVLIRPRPGNFVYSNDEFDIMLEDISMCRDLGVAGVVVGALHADNTIDIPQTRRMVEMAKPLHVTFHRAIEDCEDQRQAVEDVIDTGCSRILVSGMGNAIIEKLDSIGRMVEQAGNRIEIMPGGGVTSENVQQVLTHTGARSVHASAKSRRPKTNTAMRSKFDVEEIESNKTLIEELLSLMRRLRAPSVA
ncbi:hypothetical protein H2198_009090 [Neophaeococcomyces mojaviensis]|uniref:Uncharacterized protein n=1 Tax=Neophaeococcomyces mojaviensis TaxID=3383035 RepID=A0ACC2ZVG6_9EURO|nr:hypothetical protein H2198_009090 [Knufia sp. JES_112]